MIRIKDELQTRRLERTVSLGLTVLGQKTLATMHSTTAARISQGSWPCLKPSFRVIDMADPLDAILSDSIVTAFMSGPEKNYNNKDISYWFLFIVKYFASTWWLLKFICHKWVNATVIAQELQDRKSGRETDAASIHSGIFLKFNHTGELYLQCRKKLIHFSNIYTRAGEI